MSNLDALRPDAVVTLREITADTVHSILRLKVKPEQEDQVGSNADSIALAHFQKHSWLRAVYADETPVGFLLLYDDPDKPRYYLWRYMIAAEYQGMGFGRQALELLIAYVRTRPNAHELSLSYVPKPGGAGEFYRRLGFSETGKVEHGELEMRLLLT